jgi:hypothetical protein
VFDGSVTNLKNDYPDVRNITVSKDDLSGNPAYRNEHMIWLLDHWEKSISILSIKNGIFHEVSILAEPEEIKSILRR